MKANIISALLISIGLSASGFFVGAAISSNKEFNRYVSVKGLAEKVVKADKAVWDIRFTYANDKLNALYQGIAKEQTEIQSFLIKQGFKKEEIAMQPVSVTDNESISYSSNNKAKRYTANTGVTLTTNQVDQVHITSQKIGDLIQQGVIISSSYIKYIFSKLNEVKPGMLDLAILNAKKAAKTFAKNSNSRLGAIRQANQGVFSITAADESGSSSSSIIKKVRVVTSVEYFLR